MKIDYTLWNTTGESITIPDGVTTTWPEGDALVHNFVYNKGKLVGFVNTSALVANSSNSTTFPYDYVNITVDKSLEGVMTFNPGERTKYFTVTYSESGNSGDTIMFKYKGCKTVDDVKAVDPDYLANDIVEGAWTESLADLEDGNPTNDFNNGMFSYCDSLTTFTSDLSSLKYGDYMFSYCHNLTTFDSDLHFLTNSKCMFCGCDSLTTFNTDLSSLTDGNSMFYNCDNLTTFTSDLSSLTNGESMFDECHNLTTFDSDLSSLTDGNSMFYNCKKLTSFDSDLSSLTDGNSMFYNCNALTSFDSDLSSLTDGTSMFGGCKKLTTFSSDLSSLTDGNSMFNECHNLTTFDSDLSSLTNGNDMFKDCKLDTESIKNIAETINQYTNYIDIGIGSTTPTDDEDLYFKLIAAKGWTVYVNNSTDYTPPVGCGCGCGCGYSLMTLDENGEETPRQLIPFWAKPVPADEEHAKYIDENGNFFNILGAQFIYGDDLMNYGQFLNEEDAATQMRLTRYIKGVGAEPEIETA